MSPRRRLFAIVLLAGALAATVALVVAGVLGGRASRPVRAVPQERPGPVLLVPGYGGSAGAFGVLAARLRAEGRDVTLVALPDRATGDLERQARVLRSAATGVLRRTGAPSVDVVGYSAGGVVARLWISVYGGRDVVRRVVTLGSPQHGTDVAALAGSLAPQLCPVACQQLTTGSALLRRLNAGDETPGGPRWLSLWTTRDSVVVPPSSARLAGAVDVPLQSICPDDRTEHGALPTDPLVVGLVLRALSAAPLPAPSAADCAALRRAGS